MKKLLICLDDNESQIIDKEAKAQKRSFKAHVEFIISEYIKNKPKAKHEAAKKESWAID